MNFDHYRQQLQSIERQLVARIDADISAVGIDPADFGTDAGDAAEEDEMKDEYSALAETDSAILAQVRAALTRIDEGTYGLCTVDGAPIEQKRLDALPWTPYCFKHQVQLEQRARVRTPTM